jgi:pilus assembly protein Flp/PilA
MHKQVCEWMREWWRNEQGVTAIEYGLLAALIVVTCIGAFSATGTSLTEIYDFWTQTVIAALGG